MEFAHKKPWLLPVIIIAGALFIVFAGSRTSPAEQAQPILQTAKEDGILVVPVQTGRDNYGFVMVDTVKQTLWVYSINSNAPSYSRLKLLAARSWRYDRLLQQYNTDEPKPEQVRLLLENLEKPQKQIEDKKLISQDANYIMEVAEPNSSLSDKRQK